MMCVEQSVEWDLVRGTEVLGEKLPQRYFVHHKSHMNWPGVEPGTPVANRVSYGTVVEESLKVVCFKSA
jgi:hypothetical protein